jgi:multiple sugar transport system substrate-binding protein
MRKRFGIMLALFALFAAGCAPKAADKVELRFIYWGDLSEIEIINSIVADFERQNPTLKVKLERAPSGAPYLEKLLTEFAGGAAPDVMFVEVNNFVNFATRDVFLDLNGFIQADPDFKLDTFYPEVVDRFTVDGKLFVLPRDTAPICCVYYNKDLFDGAGLPYPTNDWQWPKDFLPVVQKLTKTAPNGRIETYGYVDDWSLWDAFVLSNGGKYVDDTKHPTRITLDSPEAIEGFQFRQDLIYKYKVMPSPSQMSAAGGVGSADLFVTGKAGLFLSGIWKTPYFREIKNFDWDIVMFPRGPKGLHRFPTGGSGYAITKQSKHPEAAWKLVRFLTSKDGQVALAKTGLVQPANMEIAQSEVFLDGLKPLNKALLLQAVKDVVYTPYLDGWNQFVISDLNPALDKVWSGELRAEEVLKRVVKKGNEQYF